MTAAFKFAKPEPRAKAPKPLRRRKWMRARRPRRLDRVGSDVAYLDWVRTQPCLAKRFGTCGGRIEAHHAGKNPGVGMKAPDRTAVPLCSRHHADLTAHRGGFRAPAAIRRLWQDEWIAETLSRYLSHGSRRAA